MISVVIPLYNKEASIAHTLRSILKQTLQDFEIVVVNDGSTDGSVEEAQSVEDNRIRIINQPNAGVSAARNRGIEEARGEWIAFLDADDEWHKDYLLTMHNLHDKYPHCNVLGCNYEYRYPDNRIKTAIIRRIPFAGTEGELSNYFEVAACSNSPLCSSTIMVKKSSIIEIGGFPLGIKSGEDLLTWARLAAQNRIAFSKTVLATVNVVGFAVTDRPSRVPAENDLVGKELLELHKHFHPLKMELYISLWHKMRSSVYMRLGMRGKSIREALIALRYNPLNYKLYAYLVINLLPSCFNPAK